MSRHMRSAFYRTAVLGLLCLSPSLLSSQTQFAPVWSSVPWDSGGWNPNSIVWSMVQSNLDLDLDGGRRFPDHPDDDGLGRGHFPGSGGGGRVNQAGPGQPHFPDRRVHLRAVHVFEAPLLDEGGGEVVVGQPAHVLERGVLVEGQHGDAQALGHGADLGHDAVDGQGLLGGLAFLVHRGDLDRVLAGP